MAANWLETYLADLARQLRAQGVYDPRILEEVREHLLDAARREEQGGLCREEARRRALERFGQPDRIAAQFASQSPRERSLLVQKILAAAALACGLAIAYIDTRPHWDDTGITAFALLACAGLFGLLAQKRPWLYALLVGAWLPAYYIATTRNLSMILVLIFPFAGAYAGWLAGRLVRKAISLA